MDVVEQALQWMAIDSQVGWRTSTWDRAALAGSSVPGRTRRSEAAARGVPPCILRHLRGTGFEKKRL